MVSSPPHFSNKLKTNRGLTRQVSVGIIIRYHNLTQHKPSLIQPYGGNNAATTWFTVKITFTTTRLIKCCNRFVYGNRLDKTGSSSVSVTQPVMSNHNLNFPTTGCGNRYSKHGCIDDRSLEWLVPMWIKSVVIHYWTHFTCRPK